MSSFKQKLELSCGAVSVLTAFVESVHETFDCPIQVKNLEKLLSRGVVHYDVHSGSIASVCDHSSKSY